MTKNKKILISGGVVILVLVAALGVFFVIKNKNQVSSQTEVDGSEKVASLNLQNSDTVPLGGSSDDSNSDNSLKVNESVPSNPASLGSGSSRSGNSSSGNSGNSSSNSGNSSAPGPESFKEYEKYKDSQNALFGDIQQGNGSEATAGKKVAVYYKGWLTNGQLFDQSVSSTFVFKLGDRQVIPGWEQTIPGMKIGGIRRIIVPPSAGYGSQAVGSIPANSVLVFDVQLVAVE